MVSRRISDDHDSDSDSDIDIPLDMFDRNVSDDDDNSASEESAQITEILNSRNRNRKRAPLTNPKPRAIMTDNTDEILEGDLLEGLGTYQGGEKGKENLDKKSLEKKRLISVSYTHLTLPTKA